MVDTTEASSELIPVVGYGSIGREVTRLLLARGFRVRVVQRSAPVELPDGASFFRADAVDCDQLAQAIDGATTIVLALGLPYRGKVWAEGWPTAMHAILAACERVGARMV